MLIKLQINYGVDLSVLFSFSVDNRLMFRTITPKKNIFKI